MTSGPSGLPLATLRRIRETRPVVRAGERCEMCAQPIADEHQHVVGLENRTLMCTCRGCYLLFSDQHAALRYRAVPDRYVSFPDFVFDAAAWDELQIPVSLAFVFRNSVQERVVAFYPSPAGATESELDAGGVGPRHRTTTPRWAPCCPTSRPCSSTAPSRGAGSSAACWCPSTSATSWWARCAPPGADSTAVRRRGPRWRSSSPAPRREHVRPARSSPGKRHDRPEVRGPRHHCRALRRRAAAQGAARHQRVDRVAGARDRAALPGPDRAAAPPVRRGGAERSAGPVRGSRPVEGHPATVPVDAQQHHGPGLLREHRDRPAAAVHLRLRRHRVSLPARARPGRRTAGLHVLRHRLHPRRGGLRGGAGAVGPRGAPRHAGLGVAEDDGASTTPTPGGCGSTTTRWACSPTTGPGTG